jgi:ankyrin repeat protein
LVFHRFRWAYCQLQELKKLKSTAPKYVKLALEALPATLDETYTRMLLGIEEIYHQQALTLLQWLAYARSPPTLGELVEATITDPIEESCIDVENRGDIEDTLNILSGLVTTQEKRVPYYQGDAKIGSSVSDVSSVPSGHANITHQRRSLSANTVVRLAHFSVKEYLESKRMLKSNANHIYLESAVAHRTLAQSCLTYLRHYNASSEKTLTKRDLGLFPLLSYAARSWFQHAALQQGGGASREISFLRLDDARRQWLRLHDPDRPLKRSFEDLVEDAGSAVYYASLLGLTAVVCDLLKSGTDVNVQGGEYGNALQAASFRGHATVVQQLLDKGADVNAQGGVYGNTLQAASSGGHTEVVRLLLGEGADVNAQGGVYGNTLQAASSGGHTEVVRLLLDKGADVNAQGGVYGNTLQAASSGGHTEVVRLLLGEGADVNARGGKYGNTLQAASSGGHKEVVQLLLDQGADVNAQGGKYGNALQAASSGGHTVIVKLLLDKGASVNAKGGPYDTPLYAASVRGDTDMMQLLEAAGAQTLFVDNDI